MKEIDILLDDYPKPDGHIGIRIFEYEEFTKTEKQLLEDLTEWLGVNKKEADQA